MGSGAVGRQPVTELPNLPVFPGVTQMKTVSTSRWTWLVIANLVIASVLGFYSTLGAAPQAGQPPFANPVEQRSDMVRELREIKELLKEQNALLRGGGTKGSNGTTTTATPSLH
jgi:hypothetical protein